MEEYIDNVIALYKEASIHIEETDKRHGTIGVGSEVELITQFIQILEKIKKKL